MGLGRRSTRGRLMEEYRIECQECEETTYVSSEDEPTFCPMCGRRPGIVELEKDLQAFNDNYDE